MAGNALSGVLGNWINDKSRAMTTENYRTPQPDWTREQIKEWVKEATGDYQRSQVVSALSAGESVMGICRRKEIEYFSAIADDSTPKAIICGDILMAILKFESETGLKVSSVNASGVDVTLTL